MKSGAVSLYPVLGTAVFCDQSNQYLVYEFPFCAMHMRVSSVSLPYLQNKLPSLIISAVLANQISTSFTNSRFVRCTCASLPCHFRIYKISCLR